MSLESLVESYKAVPYHSTVYQETSLEHLEFLSHLHGLPDPSTLPRSLLELGCASGGNLIPMAYRNPHYQFVGIDIAPNQIAKAREQSETLGLANIEFHQADLRDFEVEAECFAYVIAHGVLSWIPSEHQHALLQLTERALHPDGLAYLSYNCHPGWKERLPVRELLLKELDHSLSPEMKLKLAYERIRTLSETLTENSQRKILLKSLLEEWRRVHPSHFVHDYLEVYNTPLSFDSFCTLCSKHKLEFVSDARLAFFLGIGLNSEQRSKLTGNPKSVHHEVEHLGDQLTVRPFRRDIVSKRELSLSVPGTLDRLRDTKSIYGSLVGTDDQDTFISVKTRRAVSIKTPGLQALFLELAKALPHSLSFAELHTKCAHHFNEQQLATALLEGFTRGYLWMTNRSPIEFANVDTPQVNSLTAEFTADTAITPNALHEPVPVDPTSATLLAALGQGKTVEEIRSTWGNSNVTSAGSTDSRSQVPEIDIVLSHLRASRLLYAKPQKSA